jgi:hypothetical protein
VVAKGGGFSHTEGEAASGRWRGLPGGVTKCGVRT